MLLMLRMDRYTPQAGAYSPVGKRPTKDTWSGGAETATRAQYGAHVPARARPYG